MFLITAATQSLQCLCDDCLQLGRLLIQSLNKQNTTPPYNQHPKVRINILLNNTHFIQSSYLILVWHAILHDTMPKLTFNLRKIKLSK